MKSGLRSWTIPMLFAMVLLLLSSFASACDSETASAETGMGGSEVATDAEETSADDQSLLVAVASSLREAFMEIGQAFDQTHNAETTMTFDSSGSLQKQIEAGAPVDVFASAAMLQVDRLLEQRLVDEASVTTFAGNELVLAVPADSRLGVSSFEDLADEKVERVTTGDPVNAPHGKAAVEILTHLGLIEQVEPKLIYSKNASQTLTYVVQGEVDAGILFSTDATLGGDKVTVVATSDPGWHSEIVYVLSLVSAGQKKALAQEFIDFVKGPEARTVLERYGYILPTAD